MSSTTTTRWPGLGAALEQALGAVVLLALAHDDERLAAGQRERRHQGDGAELGAGEELERLVGGELGRQAGGDVAQQVGAGLEEVLVEVERAARPERRTKSPSR